MLAHTAEEKENVRPLKAQPKTAVDLREANARIVTHCTGSF